MASKDIYAPRINTYAEAFSPIEDDWVCSLYFSMSAITANIAPVVGVHISVIDQETGLSVVNKSIPQYSTGIIIFDNQEIKKNDDNNLYYVDVHSAEIEGGWKVGKIYKFQIRLSQITYADMMASSSSLESALILNGDKFSEWSTYCTSKAIGVHNLSFSELDNNGELNIDTSSFILNGSYLNTFNDKTTNENLYSYTVELLKDGNSIEKSDVLYTNDYINPNQILYNFQTEFETGTYVVNVSGTTINKGEFTYPFNLNVNLATEVLNIYIKTAEDQLDAVSGQTHIHIGQNSVRIEEEEGRVGLKLYAEAASPVTEVVAVRRTDSRTNFKTWETIKIIKIDNQDPNTLDMFYDYTIQSGVWYKYGVQGVILDELYTDKKVIKKYTTNLNKIDKPIIREFDFSFLLGEDGRQLKLNLNNGVSSYGYTISESKQDTIGGKFPIISRNGNMKYRTFPITGFISFNMDDRDTFSTDEELYKFKEVADLYKDLKHGQYDYMKEYEFRERVLAFFQDGKPKLFKSPTEGNILVRLMNASTSPNQSLSRMIGTFNVNATEIAEPTLSNYIKYKLHSL